MNILKTIDRFVKPVIWYSVVMTIIEMSPELSLGGKNSLDGHQFFLWSERIVAVFFTLEFLIRLRLSEPEEYISVSRRFPFVFVNGFAIVDIVSILPFWLGFFLSPAILNFVRVARILRLLKYYRYSRHLQLNALGFYRAWHQLKSLFFQVFITLTIFIMLSYEAEHEAQPDKFGTLFESAWFAIVTATTVGYGDRSPVTKIGMVFVGLTLPIIIAQLAGAIGIFNSVFNQVMEEERDPTIDPIALFKEERARARNSKEVSS